VGPVTTLKLKGGSAVLLFISQFFHCSCPVGIAYATITPDAVSLYCDPAKVAAPAVKDHLMDVTLKAYDDIVPDLAQHCETVTGAKVWMDKSRANLALASVVPEKALLDAQNAVTPMKACKNEAELAGIRRAHVVDGAAMAEFMAWLKHTIVEDGRPVSEVEIDEKLTACRARQPGFLEVSFPTIAGVGPNGAIVHYRAEEGNELMKYLDKENPILIDSGGQYTYGTTDVTRTWHFGTPTPDFVDMYTRVLKGHIGVDEMVYPENTPGFVLDVFARRWLWHAGKDYGHGTGHGVGAALNVHEGPMSISPRWANKEVLKKGMVVSNEPGYYEDGNYGIRIENLLEIQFVNPADENNGGDEGSADKKFLKFGKLTMIPIQKNLINIGLMTEAELDWLDSYHEEVLAKVGPLLEEGSPAMSWLENSCGKIDRV
jgi:Xaa-Pro aminopeptidase